jgi:hypothetical protein
LLQRTAQSEAPPASEVRLWSGVSAALEQIDRGRSQTPAPSRSPFWVPAVAVAALVLATISMFQTLAPLPDDETAVIRVGPSPPSAFEDSDPKFGPSPPDQVQFRLDKDQAPRER